MLFGILGLGSIGDRHARNLMNLGHQVIFHDPDKLGSLPRDQVLQLSDAVVICTPTQDHFRDLCDATHANCHVLVEKPIGYDCPPLFSGFIMGMKMKSPDLVVATGFMCRFHPMVLQAKADLTSGFFGSKIHSAVLTVAQRNDRPAYLRDGVIRNWLSHEIDIARYLFGDLHVDEAGALTDEHGQDIAATLHMSTLDNHETSVIITGDYHTKPFVRHIQIIGEQRSHLYNLEVGQDIWDQTYVDEMIAFIDKIEGKVTLPLADAYDGIAALEIVMQARAKAGLE